MKVKSQIPSSIIASAAVLLQEYVPDLSPSSLIEALRRYGETGGRRRSKSITIPPKGISRREAAELLGCSVGTVHNYLKSGRLKGGKIGPRKWEIDPESVIALLPGNAEEQKA